MKKIAFIITFAIILIAPAFSESYSQQDMIFRSGKARFENNLYEDSIPAFEYVVSNGKLYSQADYYEAFQKLLVSYNKTGKFGKTIDLFEKFQKIPDKVIDSAVSEKITERACDAYVGRGDYEKAVALCQDNERLLSELYIRLGVASYNRKSLGEALNFFDLAVGQGENEKVNASGYPVAALYRARILLDDVTDNLSGIKEENLNNAKEAESILKKIEKKVPFVTYPDFSDSYYACYLKTEMILKNYKKAREVYKKIGVIGELSEYYGAYLDYLNGDYETAEKTYKKLIDSGFVKDNQVFSYAVCLYKNEKYSEALKVAKKYDSFDASLICGDACFNLERWDESLPYYRAVLREINAKNNLEEPVLYSFAYSSFRAGNFEDSLSSFAQYQEKFSGNAKAYSAVLYALQSAIILGDYDTALMYAEKNIKLSHTAKERENAVLIKAQIYLDTKRYDACQTLLDQNKNTTTEFGIKCLEMVSRLYYSQKEYEKAYRSYSQMTQVNWDDPNKLMEINYYLFDCDVKLSKKTQIISRGEDYLKKYPASPYCVSVLKEVFEAYYDNKKYSEAFAVAQKLENQYKTTARSAGIESQVNFIKKIMNGDQTLKEAEKLYDDGKLAAAAEKYLVAAEVLRETGNEEKAAMCLYTATECFAAENQSGNAGASAELLKKLYPNSKYSTAVDRINY